MTEQQDRRDHGGEAQLQRDLERRIAESQLNESRLEAILQLGHMTDAPLKRITDFALEQAVTLTKSKIGYLAFMNEDETVLTMHSWSKEAMAECAVANKPLIYPLETTGLWGEAARQRKPIVTNDYSAANPWKKGVPEGHIQLCRTMNVPVLDGKRVVIVAGVANNKEPYNDSDVRQLTLLMEGVWALLERRRVQDELRQYRNHLEQLVVERTGALAESEEKYRHLVEATDTGYVILDEEGRVLDANAEYVRISGHKALGDILDRKVLQWTAPGDVDRNAKAVGDCLVRGQVRHFEIDYAGPNGKITPIGINASVVHTQQGKRIVSLCRDITDQRMAEAALERERRTLEHMLQASDHERQLIAYDIHDGLAQQLAGAIMQFQVFDHFKETQPEEAANAYHGGMALLRQSHFEARRLISGVRPPILDESGVVAAIAHLVNDPGVGDGPKIEFHTRVQFSRLPAILENAIYRIAQEGLTNACKHSKSEYVQISLLQRGTRVRLKICDAGIGFDPTSVQENRFGLAGIRERARLLGGKCRIVSKPGSGTSITVELPIVVR